ncbi:MAG TPA: CoA ester lyase [Methylomirabilota bacterium]|jgi:citrate lyase subunit beta/citryl-CoA lyase|nr:CoA ester lyase [Methylomirabilota bacterium]
MSRLRRAVHFVPGANEKMLQKSLALPADSLVLDLEDAVTPDNKDSAREVVTRWLKEVDFGRQERMVRMNPLDTPWGVKDLEVTMQGKPDSYLVPKVRTKDDLLRIDTIISRMEREYGYSPGGVKLVVLATETPQGLLNIRDFGSCPRVDALSWGAEDLSAAIGARRNRDEHGQFLEVFRYARIMTLLAATAANVQPLDTVFVDIKDIEGLRRDCREGAWMGFTGKITIHPSQIEVVNEVFTPSPEEIAESKELLAAFEENQKAGRMAFSFKGQMVDVPHLTRARTILERARLAGLST